eukprot:11214051-Lingulodinium_polyedra.AAC.1
MTQTRQRLRLHVFWLALANTLLLCPIAYFALQQRRSNSGAAAQPGKKPVAQPPRAANPAGQGIIHFTHGP